MDTMYSCAARMAELSSLLEDKRSKDIFWARLRFDCEPNLDAEAQLYSLSGVAEEEEIRFHREFKDFSSKVKAEGKKLFLYGIGVCGTVIGRMILGDGGDFYAYCDRNYERYPNGALGKPVYPPEYLFEHPDECFALITSFEYGEEISNTLMSHHFPQRQIKFWLSVDSFKTLLQRTYFDFPELFPKGTAFVDAGCYACDTSIIFAQWCGGDYSEIFAFEPDPKNYERCQAAARDSNLKMKLYPMGLSDRSGTLHFASNGSGDSFLIDEKEIRQTGSINDNLGRAVKEEICVKVAALDDIVGDTPVGLIKMDIEGAELDALRGARHTILRDKPQLAICVYHRRGDVLAIMDYLHGLMPHYRFWLRQYSAMGTDTVLYAAL